MAWAVWGVVAIGVFETYARFPAAELYNVTRTGLAGAGFVTVAVLTIRPLGVTLQTAAIIVGQLTMAAVVDHYGLLGVQVRPLTAAHAGGLGLLAAGVAILAKF